MSHISEQEKELKKQKTSLSTNNLLKTKVTLPSRYAQSPMHDKKDVHGVLNSIESTIELKSMELQNSPDKKGKKLNFDKTDFEKSKNNSKFKTRPLKREDNDKIQFAEIFLHPRQEILNSIKKVPQSAEHNEIISNEYEKMLRFEKTESESLDFPKNEQSTMGQGPEDFEIINFEDSFGLNAKKRETDFYDHQIEVEASMMVSTGTIVSNLKVSQSTSIPPNYKAFKDFSLKELLIRAKAGNYSEDVIKEAHLSFFLAALYAEKKKFKDSLKFSRRFLGFAKMMEDRVGMCVGANRVGISYFECKEYEKSITFHNENLRLSDHDNCFIGFYNIGISFRKLKKQEQALEYFMSALSWAQQRGEEESECIVLGQIGTTYQDMELFQESLEHLEQSLDICYKIKKKDLTMINLVSILKISSILKLKSKEQLMKIANEAFECAKDLGQMSSLDTLRCNIGILKGSDEFSSGNEIEEIEEIQE